MAENDKTAENQQGAANENKENKPVPGFDLRQVYLKDASFESPESPFIFAQLTEHPKVDLEINVKYKPINEEKSLYEVVLYVQAIAKLKDKTAFLAEVQQAGIFLIRNFKEQDIQPMMEIVGANQIFPYVRESVSSLATRGGFPPVMINPINFEVLYRQKLASQAQQQQNPAATGEDKNEAAPAATNGQGQTTH